MAEVAFDFKKFIDETKATLLTPADYFSVMPKTGGFAEPLIKTLIYGFTAVFINFVWAIINLRPFADAFGGMFGYGFGIGIGSIFYIWLIFLSILFYVFALFVLGAIILVISAICEGNTDYEANVRISASLMVLAPISVFFGFLERINLFLGSTVSIIIVLYGFWMLYNAITKSLNGNIATAKIITIIISIIPVLVILSSLVCSQLFGNLFGNKMNTIPDQMMRNIPVQEQDEMKKALEEATKNLDQIKNELEEESKEAQK